MTDTPTPPKFELKIRRIHPDAIVPVKAHKDDLGWDLFSLEDVVIPVFSRKLIRTGIAIGFPQTSYGSVGGIIKDRSGVASEKGLFIHAGVIDPGYTGEIKILMANSTKVPVEIKKGDKIAQLILMPVFIVNDLKVVDELDDTDRGEKGFGSSG